MSIDFIVTIGEDALEEAKANGITRAVVAKHIKTELKASCGFYMPGDWEFSLLRQVTVKPSHPIKEI